MDKLHPDLIDEVLRYLAKETLGDLVSACDLAFVEYQDFLQALALDNDVTKPNSLRNKFDAACKEGRARFNSKAIDLAVNGIPEPVMVKGQPVLTAEGEVMMARKVVPSLLSIVLKANVNRYRETGGLIVDEAELDSGIEEGADHVVALGPEKLKRLMVVVRENE